MNRFVYVFLLVMIGGVISCKHVEVKERVADIPGHEWNKKSPAVVELDVTDTATYQLFLIVRHSLQYRYNNIVVNVAIKDTANRSLNSFRVNASLVTPSGNWAGSNIDDLYDHRIRLNTAVTLKKNRYRFVITQLMKDDPLPYILNVGMGIEKTTPPQ
ncbi:gliding motility lipoprotein GldH [Niabella beijingensis]|uniref:gliding motility lipoprotein GldH n=1 Tax=Niabella beijingensis TaxID=2872700 RepID=UPI001CBDE29A|nr:gliding motility lipoprotein GldH [Niabella beijingensis]MBZ4188752.1 gliding motility lipoprotein GldH [Niabella beijingensis]